MKLQRFLNEHKLLGLGMPEIPFPRTSILKTFFRGKIPRDPHTGSHLRCLDSLILYPPPEEGILVAEIFTIIRITNKRYKFIESAFPFAFRRPFNLSSRTQNAETAEKGKDNLFRFCRPLAFSIVSIDSEPRTGYGMVSPSFLRPPPFLTIHVFILIFKLFEGPHLHLNGNCHQTTLDSFLSQKVN